MNSNRSGAAIRNKMRNGSIPITMNVSPNIHKEIPENTIKEAYLNAGADYVITSLAELKELIRMINSRLEFRERS